MKGIDQNLSINGLTCADSRANMPSGEQPSYLENDISAQSTVQTTREYTSPSGCRVKMFFKKEHDPGIRKEIAQLLLTAFEQGGNDDNLSNEGISLLENASHLGLPVPDKLKNVLSQLHNKESEDDQSDDHQEE